MTSVTPNSALVGHNLEVECRVRGKRPLSEVIFYRDGVEVSRQQGNAPRLLLSNLTTKDQGMYSCRASWNTRGQTHSVISSDTLGRVLGEFHPLSRRQIQPFQSTSCVLFLQRFCPNQIWRSVSSITRAPTG